MEFDLQIGNLATLVSVWGFSYTLVQATGHCITVTQMNNFNFQPNCPSPNSVPNASPIFPLVTQKRQIYICDLNVTTIQFENARQRHLE